MFKRFCRAILRMREEVYLADVRLSTSPSALSAAFFKAFSRPSVQSQTAAIFSLYRDENCSGFMNCDVLLFLLTLVNAYRISR